MIHAMRAALLNPEWADRVIPPPYDSLSSEQRQAHLEEFPDSFLHVARSAGVGHGHPTEHRRLAAEGDASLQRLLADGAYAPREESRLYVQRIRSADGEQLAVLGAIRDGERKVLPHEEVHPGRVRALAAHFSVVGAMSSPVVVTSRPSVSDRSLIDRVLDTTPLRDVEASDGTRLTLWPVDVPEFDICGDLYVVDGHHRVAAASMARFDQLFVAYVPPEELHLRSFDRVLDELALMPRKVADLLEPYCEVTLSDDAHPPPAIERGSIVMRLGQQTVALRRRDNSGLDAQFIHDIVLPVGFGVEDAADPRLTYRPSGVEAGPEPVVIRSAPVNLAAVLDVADAGGVMPPKSTYFVPKARSGFLLVPC